MFPSKAPQEFWGEGGGGYRRGGGRGIP